MNNKKLYQHKLSETNIQSAVMMALESLPGGRVLRFRNNPIIRVINGREVPIRQSNRFCPRGVADIVFLYKSTSAWIEIKTEAEYKFVMKHYDRLRDCIPKNKRESHLQEQIRFLEDVRDRTGNKAFFTFSVSDCMDKLGFKFSIFTFQNEYEG
jgi:hypothetical protein